MLKRLPPNKFVTCTPGNQTNYVYADPTGCKCLYVGTQQGPGGGATPMGGLGAIAAPMNGYPKVFNIESDPQEDHNIGEMYNWVLGPILKTVQEYKKTLVRSPNPPAANMTKFLSSSTAMALTHRKGTTMFRHLIASLACSVLLIPVAAGAAKLEVGKLECDISKGVGMIIETKQTVSCTFTPSPSGPTQTYKGSIDEFGLAVGDVKAGRMVWLVSSVSGKPVSGLQGTYRGVEADASLGLGGGAKVLVGGSRDSVSLQPLSLEGEEGVNVAIGVASLKLSEVD